MKFTLTLTLILFGLIQSSENCGKSAMRNSADSNKLIVQKTIEKIRYDRLPENITAETKVRRAINNEKGETISFEITTIEKRLNELGAQYENDKLVDKNKREIRFFEPLCRGVSRGFEEDEQDRKAKDAELAELEKKYTVVVLHCDPQNVM